MIQLKNVKKVYNSNGYQTQALKGVDITFPYHGLISIVGASGCGKTTLLNLIGGLDSDYDGEIIFNNQNIKKYKSSKLDKYRSNEIGFIFQEYNLINTLNVYANIELALSLKKVSKKEKKKQIVLVAQRLGIEKLLYKHPLQLSGGEKQRVAIARAIVKEPKVLLADEPTGALDSKTSIEIMNVLKDISNDYLVIMVTHNEHLAYQFSNRIVNMLDGKVIKDEEIDENPNDKNLDIEIKNLIPNNKNLDIKNENKFPFFQLLKISLHNLYKKLVRTLLMIFACSIGIVALCLVITVASGMNLYIEDVQEQALRTYPITINSVVESDYEEENITYEQYPDDDIIHIIDSPISYNDHVNTFSNEFMNYIRTMDSSYYSAISYTGWVKMRLLSKYDNQFYWINSYSYMKELNYDYQYVKYEYDILEGVLPEKKEDLVLVIDKNNCINRYVLESLGIETNNLKEIKFSDIIGKTYKVITPDIYYKSYEDGYKTYSLLNYTTASIYEEASLELQIKGIIRQKSSAKTKLYNTSILYSPLLTDYLLQYNRSCEIVKKQLDDPSVNVFTGKKFAVIETDSLIQTIEYQYENNLTNLGANFIVSRILIYTDKFDNFEIIHNYIENYNDSQISVNQIKYTDYLKDMTDEFSTFMNVLTKVLLLFAIISLTVAAIMIVIITYVSVLEKTKQVGILRSLGMSKSNIMTLFINENAILGLSSGIIGVSVGTILINPILNLIVNVIKDINLNSFDVNNLKMNGFNIVYLTLLIIGSMLLTILSGIIPSIIAANYDPVKALQHQ